MKETKINITGHCPIFKVPFNLFDFKEEDLQTINSTEELTDGMKVLVPNFSSSKDIDIITDFGLYSIMDVENDGTGFYGRSKNSSALLKFIEDRWVCTGIMNFGMISAGKKMIVVDNCE